MAKAWKTGSPGEPAFPNKFDVKQKAALQVTDIKTNRNKYYAVELHVGKLKGKDVFRVYTHYGRTDDLEKDPSSGQRESRYFDTLDEAVRAYDKIYRQKTSPAKGYKELSLASSNIGSDLSRGTSTGDVDDKTIEKLAKNAKKAAKKKKAKKAKRTTLPSPVQKLVRYIYDEATNALTTTVNAKITANGIETPLGILTLGQIEKGEDILQELYSVFKKRNSAKKRTQLEDLSSEFYTVVPHRIGRSRAAVAEAVINSMEDFQTKQDTLQLMKDMLEVNGDANVLFDSQIDDEYKALQTKIVPIEKGTPAYEELEDYIIRSQIDSNLIKVKGLYKIERKGEKKRFKAKLANQRLLFHGSGIQNWVGILTRGLLMPKIVTSMGVNRTDAGWLGNGIYFGDAACTSVFYTTPGRSRTRMMTLATVALGKQKRYTKITYGLDKPPKGYHSCHGVRSQKGQFSEFDDDEYVIYDAAQQRLDYLCEFTA